MSDKRNRENEIIIRKQGKKRRSVENGKGGNGGQRKKKIYIMNLEFRGKITRDKKKRENTICGKRKQRSEGKKKKEVGADYIYTLFILLQGLLRNHQEHGCEQLHPPTSHQIVRSDSQAISGLLRPLRQEAYGLHPAHELVGKPTTPPGHACEREDVTQRRHVLPRPGERVVPRDLIGTISQVLRVLEFESRGLDGVQRVRRGHHVGDAVTLLDPQADLAVERVVVVVVIRHDPFVDAKRPARFEDFVDLTVDPLEAGGVDGGLDGVDGVEAVRFEVHLHKVTLGEAHFRSEAFLFGISCCALDLVVVVVQPDDVDAGEFHDFARGPADSAADVEHFLVLP